MDLVDVCFDIVEAIPYPYKFTNHLSLSLGSHGEVETLFEMIRRRKLVPEALLSKGLVLIDPVGKMLHGLVGSLEPRANARHS
jgi:four helix bundle protein